MLGVDKRWTTSWIVVICAGYEGARACLMIA